MRGATALYHQTPFHESVMASTLTEARLDAKSLRNIVHQTGFAPIFFNFVSVGNTQSSKRAETIWTSNTQTTPDASFATRREFLRISIFIRC